MNNLVFFEYIVKLIKISQKHLLKFAETPAMIEIKEEILHLHQIIFKFYNYEEAERSTFEKKIFRI